MLRCVLFPSAHLFVTTGGNEKAARHAKDKIKEYKDDKEKSAEIEKKKVEELCKHIPGLKNEINWERGQSKASQKMVEYIFKNGSKLDIIAAQQSSRGKRATGGLMEECILIDQTLLNEVIIPTMNVDRRLSDGSRQESEPTNKSQIYVNFFKQKLTRICI